MKILAVCGFGVGSSMVLKMSLDNSGAWFKGDIGKYRFIHCQSNDGRCLFYKS